MIFPRKLFMAPKMDVNEAITEMVCLFEILRMLHYQPDDIYMHVIPLDTSEIGLRVMLQQREKKFVVDCGVSEGSLEKVTETLRQRVGEHNSDRGKDFRKTLHQSQVWERRVQICVSLALMGFGEHLL